MKDMYKDRLLELVAKTEYFPDTENMLLDYVDQLMRMEYQRGIDHGKENIRSMLIGSICEAITKI